MSNPKPLTKGQRKVMNEAAGVGFVPFWRLASFPELFGYFRADLSAPNDMPTTKLLIKNRAYRLNEKGREAQRTGAHKP